MTFLFRIVIRDDHRAGLPCPALHPALPCSRAGWQNPFLPCPATGQGRAGQDAGQGTG